MGTIIMGTKDQRFYDLALEVIHQRLTIAEFSTLIGKSYRQSKRIIKNVRKHGMMGVKHRNTGKIPANKTSPELELEIVALLKGKYYDFNLTHFREMIKTHEGICIGKNVIHRLARKHNLVKRPKKAPRKRVHKPRPRMPQEGMLIQFDGSFHIWFGNFESTLIGGIDDATGDVVEAEFFIGETSLHCMKVMKDIILKRGIPGAYYLDQAGYFGKDDREQASTQIGRALEQLGCKIVIATSPQAKGKIERLWNTMQDRLIAELRFYDIKTITQANIFLKENFLPRYNNEFKITARESAVAYRKVPEEIELENIFCIKEKRKVSSGNTFSWDGKTLVVDEEINYRYRNINVNTHYSGAISFDISGRPVNVKKHDHCRGRQSKKTENRKTGVSPTEFILV